MRSGLKCRRCWRHFLAGPWSWAPGARGAGVPIPQTGAGPARAAKVTPGRRGITAQTFLAPSPPAPSPNTGGLLGTAAPPSHRTGTDPATGAPAARRPPLRALPRGSGDPASPGLVPRGASSPPGPPGLPDPRPLHPKPYCSGSHSPPRRPAQARLGRSPRALGGPGSWVGDCRTREGVPGDFAAGSRELESAGALLPPRETAETPTEVAATPVT